MSAALRNQSSPARRIPENDTLVSDVAPRPTIDPAALSYHLLRPRQAGPADVLVLGEAYRCWLDVWRDTFSELEGSSELRSDDFSRQDEVGALFHGYECIALSFFRWVDLQSPITRNDSYFSVWPEEIKDRATAEGSRVCVSSNFTIAQGFRQARGCSLKDVLGALVVERFLVSDAAALVGTMRADRGMSRLTDRLGFRRLHATKHHGVEVDLVTFYRSECKREAHSPEDEAIVQALRPRGEP